MQLALQHVSPLPRLPESRVGMIVLGAQGMGFP